MGVSNNKSLAVYIHWPFCKAKCPYCDFNSHVADSIDHNNWKNSYLQELKHYSKLVPNRKITSIYFGGGTPSLMSPDTVSAVINEIYKYWNVDKDIEVTLEANPTSVEIEKLASMKRAGIKRVSLGVQSLNDSSLKFLGREHSSKEAIRAIDVVKGLFDNYTFDLIYALPGQTIELLKEEVTNALKLCENHISMYQLTIEKGTPFFNDHKNGKFTMPGEDIAVEMYEMVEKMANRKGLKAYEVSNYAKPGFESKHNVNYWKYGEYLGIGPGAHGRVDSANGRHAVTNVYNPEKWMSLVNDKGVGVQQKEAVDSDAYLEEFLLMGLRLREGISRDDFILHIGDEPESVLNTSVLVQQGFIEIDEFNIRATKPGRLLLNMVIAKLLAK